MAFSRFRQKTSSENNPGSNDPSRPGSGEQTTINSSGPDDASTLATLEKDPVVIKRATRTRRHAIFFASFCYLVSVVFIILVEIGNTSGASVRSNIYFFKLDLANVVAQSLPPGLTLTNSIARTLGLHDFYQIGLWNFCEGYANEGITHCSKPTNFWWFNPVEILTNELLSGASITLPSEVNEILNILRLASHIMFGFFIAGCVLNFVLMFLGPIVLFSRWWSLPMSLLSFISLLMVLGGTCLGSAMSLVAKYALSSQPELNVSADVGINMFAFMWVATAFTIFAFFIHAGLGCCCASKRDVRTGRKGTRYVRAAAAAGQGTGLSEKSGSKFPFKKSKAPQSPGPSESTP